jgi:hypothetical protein
MNDIVFGYLHCGRKVRYRSEARARRVCEQMRKKGKGNIEPYFCTICEGWHNGHRKKGEKNED